MSDLSCICNLSAATTLPIKTCTDICCGSNVFLVSHFSNPFVGILCRLFQIMIIMNKRQRKVKIKQCLVSNSLQVSRLINAADFPLSNLGESHSITVYQYMLCKIHYYCGVDYKSSILQ